MNDRFNYLKNIIEQKIDTLNTNKSSYSKGKLNAYKDILNLLRFI